MPRRRLLDRLNQVIEKPVALISAPAGFGKTTLLCQWLAECPLPSAWLQLDANDNDFPLFLTYFVSAIRQIFPESFAETANLLLSKSSIPDVVWQIAVINDLDALSEAPFVLVLDDYHLLHNPRIDALLSEILLNQPAALHLVITARLSPALPFSRLRVQEQLVEIHAVELRFNHHEISDYFKQTVNTSLNETDLLQLEEITEGWAAGLSLAAISLAEGSDLQDLISRLNSSDRWVSDYLFDQVLSDQPIDIQNFLLKTSLLNRLCEPLCQAVIGSEGTHGQAPAYLEQIERAQLFLIPLDDRHYWFRYHTLFQGMLKERLKSYCTSSEIDALHRRAADWLASKGLVDEAIEHLFLIQDWHGTACLVERGLCDQLNCDDIASIQRRLALFSSEFIQVRPGLLLGQAWLGIRKANYPLVDKLVQQAQAAINRAVQDNSQSQTLFKEIDAAVMRAHCDALKSIVSANYNQPSEGAVYANRALAALPEKWSYVRGTTMMHFGWCIQANGQGKAAVQLLTDAYWACLDHHSQYGVRLLFGLALVYNRLGEYEQSRQAAELLEREAQANHLPDLQGWSHYFLGRTYLEWNEFERAAEHFAWTVRQRFVVNFNCVQDSLVSWVYALHALGRTEEVSQALALFSQFEQQQTGIPNQWLLSLKAWLAMQTGDQEAARNWAESLGPFSVGQSILYLQISHLYKAHILIELETPATLQAAHQLIDELQAVAERTHNAPLIVRLMALRAICFDAQGQVAVALDMIQQALQIALRGRFIFTFFSLGQRMEVLLRGLSRRMVRDPEMERYLHDVLDAFSQAPAPLASPSTLLPDMQILLTDRQYDVLEMLAQRLSIKEIAERLFISPSTVRQHTIQIYRKLGVNNKLQAIAVARQQRLIK